MRSQALATVLISISGLFATATISPTVAQPIENVCTSGPYLVTGISENDVLPSTRRQVSALGLAGVREGCTFRIVCAVRPSNNEADRKSAINEATNGCNGLRSALLATGRLDSEGNTLASNANRTLRDSVQIKREAASEQMPAGSAVIYLSK